MEESNGMDGGQKVSKRLITVKEATEELSISKWTLYQLLRRNEIKSIKIGSRRLIPSTEIDAYIQRNTDDTNQWS